MNDNSRTKRKKKGKIEWEYAHTFIRVHINGESYVMPEEYFYSIKSIGARERSNEIRKLINDE